MRRRSQFVACGDSCDLLQGIEADSIDLTVTSPPYDNLRTYEDTNDGWGERKWKAILSELYRVTKPGGVLVWIVNDGTVNGSRSGTSFRQALWAMECGFNLNDPMIWKKPGAATLGAYNRCYYPCFEFMFVFSKGVPSTFNPIEDRLNVRARCRFERRSTKRRRDGTMRRVGGWIKGKQYGRRFNIWEINPRGGGMASYHSASFPEQLAADHIQSWSNPGDWVLDPFMGSGTTGVAAMKMKRRFIGFELCEKYYNSAVRRLRICHEVQSVALDL